MDVGLSGRVALVTGGSGAIGQALARVLATEGAAVALTYREGRQRAEVVAKEITAAGGTAVAVHYDMEQPDGGAQAVAVVADALGPATVIVANAVLWPLFDDELTGLRASLLANTLGPAALIDAALPAMRAGGWGRVVAVSSDVVAQPMAGHSSYVAAKLGLEGVIRVLAVREARHGVLSNVVRPGFTLTERGLAIFGQEVVDQEAAVTPTGRICTPHDVANVVAFLASAANGHVNGQTVSVAGGRELTR